MAQLRALIEANQPYLVEKSFVTSREPIVLLAHEGT